MDVLFEDIIDDRVDVLIHVLEEERESVFDGHLQLFQEIAVVEGANLQKEG